MAYPARSARAWSLTVATGREPSLMNPIYLMLRVVRYGPLVPARLWLDDAEPGEPSNKLDRGNVSVYPRAEIAGSEADPDIILDRLGIWQRRGDGRLLPPDVIAALADAALRTPRPVGHWAYAQPISPAEYAYQMAHREWIEATNPGDGRLYARGKLRSTDVPLPKFKKHGRYG